MSGVEAPFLVLRPLRPWQIGAWSAAAIGALGLCVGLWHGSDLGGDQVYRSYLTAFIFWSGIPLGSLVFIMIYALVGGAWGQVVKPVLLVNIRQIPLLAVLFVPLSFGVRSLYPWARPGALLSPDLAHKLGYLNPTFYLGRTAVYFLIWGALALVVGSMTQRSDQRSGPAPQSLRALCAFGLIVFVLTSSLAAVDWVMSLEVKYSSSVFGLGFATEQALVALAFTVAFTMFLRHGHPFQANEVSKAPEKVARDLGSLLATLVLLWAYLQFSQLLINWSGDTTREIPWYVHRVEGAWPWVSGIAAVAQFGVPFFVLLFRGIKGRFVSLAWVAAGMVVAHVIETYWLVVPSFPADFRGLTWLDGAAFLAIGGVLLGAMMNGIERRVSR